MPNGETLWAYSKPDPKEKKVQTLMSDRTC